MGEINHRAWAENMIGFIRSKGLEHEHRDWSGGFPCPVTSGPALPPTASPQDWADAVVAFIGCTMAGATIADVMRGRALLDAMPADGLPRAWRDVGEMLGTWVRRREQLTRVVGFTLPKPMLDRALADMPQPPQVWQRRKDVA